MCQRGGSGEQENFFILLEFVVIFDVDLHPSTTNIQLLWGVGVLSLGDVCCNIEFRGFMGYTPIGFD